MGVAFFGGMGYAVSRAGLSSFFLTGVCKENWIMDIQMLMLEFAQAMGGISKKKDDFWILEIPLGDVSRVVFFRLNEVSNGPEPEHLLAFFTELGEVDGTRPVQFYQELLRRNHAMRYARIALRENRMVLLSTAHEAATEELLLEMLHEVVYAGSQLQKEFFPAGSRTGA